MIVAIAVAISLAAGEDVPVQALDVAVAIVGYERHGDVMDMVVEVTNHEAVPVGYSSHREEDAIIRTSWQVDENWVEEHYGVCGVGLQKWTIASGGVRRFTHQVGRQKRDPESGVKTWTWTPAAWPIRASLTLHRLDSPDWWTVLSEPAGIDDDLRAIMLSGVASRPAPRPIIAAVPAAQVVSGSAMTR